MNQKIRIMKKRPEITDEEIRQYMNFDALEKQYENQKQSNRQWLRNTVAIVAMATLGIVGYYAFHETAGVPNAPQPLPQEPTSVQADSATKAHTEVAATPASTNRLQNEAVQPKESEKPLAEKPQPKTARPDKDSVATTAAAPVYVEATPVAGYPHLYDYFRKELHYPEEALKDSIQGVVTVSFVINAQGKPEQVTSQNSLGEAFDKEALRLIENMPAWQPATLNGQPVRARISIPLTFQIVNKPKD